MLKKIGIIRYHIKRMNKFDEITKLRLISLGIIIFLLQLYTPIIAEFKGKYLYLNLNGKIITAATIIAALGVLEQILKKFMPRVLENIKFSNIIVIKIITEIFIVFVMFVYFFNKTLFTWLESLLALINSVLVLASSISFNNYIAFFHKEKFPFFQNYRIELVSEIIVLGLFISIFLSYINISLNIIFSIIIYIWFIVYQIKMLKKIKKYDFLYMLKYKRAKKNK